MPYIKDQPVPQPPQAVDYVALRDLLKKVGFNTNVQELKSDNFVEGSAGWRIKANGDVQFNQGTFTGSLAVNSLDIPDTITASSFHVDPQGNTWWGATAIGSAVAKILKTGIATFANVVITGGSIDGTPISNIPNSTATDISLLGYSHDLVFSSSDADTVVWTSGAITMSNGRTFAISSGSTGNMTNRTFIYLDTGISSTVLQTGMTASAAVGSNKILIAVAQNDATLAIFQVYGGYGGLGVNSAAVDVSNNNWSYSGAWSVTDSNTIAWGAGTLKVSNGTSYSIAGGNTGNMAVKTYVYFDLSVSTTDFQTTTSSTTTVGAGKILIAVCVNGTSEASFIVVNDNQYNIDAANIVAGSITANEIAVGTITAALINVSQLSAIAADMGAITAGTITLNSSGNIKSGQTAYNTGTGFFLGIVAGTAKFSIGDASTKSLTWDGTTLTINGTIITNSSISSIPNNSSTDISILAYSHDLAYSSSDTDTVAWSAGTITMSNGRTFSISGGNTGNMAARTFIYLDTAVSSTVLQTGTTASGAVGANKILIAVAQNDATLATFQVYGGVGGIGINSSASVDIANNNWSFGGTWSVTDADTVAWGAGTLKVSSGTSYSISSGNTGNMAAKTYVYLDIAVSTTVFQTTTSATTAVGDGKILIAICVNGATEARFIVVNDNQFNLDAANIVAGSVTANELATGSVTAAKISVSQLSAIAADLGAITAGTITLDTAGYLRGGQTAYNSGAGFFLGYSTAAYKFSIGDGTTANSITWDGTTLLVKGATLAQQTIFGTGVDGTVTWDGAATILGMAPVANVYTLTRDIYVDTGTVNAGVTIITAGYRIFSKTLLTNDGTIKRSGNNGANAVASTGGLGGVALTAGTIYGGLAGGDGSGGVTGNTNGVDGIAGGAQTESIGVVGLVGGAGGFSGASHGGGNGGAAGALTASVQGIGNIAFAVLLREFQGENVVKYIKTSSGSGGGGSGGSEAGGGGGTSGGGGGAGSSGGLVFIAAKTLTNNGTISANGGNGGNGGDSSSGVTFGGGGGGGSGGSGGTVVLIYNTITLGTVTATGGVKGTKGLAQSGSGSNGADGSNGTTGTIYQFQT